MDYKDPMVLGRIRARPEKNVDYEAIKKAVNFNEDKDKWKSNDPFIFLPLLPFYTYIVPQTDEYVGLIYQNKKFKFQNQFYIPGILSSPMALAYEHYVPATKYLAQGDLVAASLALLDNNGEYREATSKGIFPEPGHNSLLGRGSTDVILKPEEVLIRAGKTNSLDKTQAPKANNFRAFIQLSNFTQQIVDLPSEFELIQEVPTVLVKKMVMWHILNLESKENFTGWVRLYDILPNSPAINSSNFNVETVTKLSDGTDYSFTGIYEDITAKSMEESIQIINKFIEGIFNGRIQTKGINISEQFPFVVTPDPQTYTKGNKFQAQNENDIVELSNYVQFFTKIKLNRGLAESGFFIVSENKNGNPIIGILPKVRLVENKPQEVISSPITYGIMGAQKLYFLSHDVAPGPKGKVNIENSVYGLTQELFTRPNDNIELQTYPTVRGDQLIILLRKMMAFISGHVHPASAMPPVPVAAGTGQSSTEIDFLLASAENTILNQNIRIN